MENLLRMMVDRATAKDEDEWMRCCLGFICAGGGFWFTDSIVQFSGVCGEDFGVSSSSTENSLCSYNFPSAATGNSGSSSQGVFPPSAPPSAIVMRAPPSDSDITLPLAPGEGHNDAVKNAGRHNARLHRRPRRFDSTVRRVPAKRDGGRQSVEMDEMALPHLPTDANNASIPVVMATKDF
ncbi:uncharacterized protein [Aquarana catesbeiana]|uniref:uncharacterized protein isoform X2 n=1 Tax=Aquarana catesbeiana TaxID=8400 RepID=UPI003CCA26C9